MGQSPPGSTYNEVGEGLPFTGGQFDLITSSCGVRPKERAAAWRALRYLDEDGQDRLTIDAQRNASKSAFE